MSWIQTYTGKAFYPLEPRAEDISIHDIAHALSMQCRFAGHCHEFYSVAEHSVRVAEQLYDVGAGPAVQFAGLLHDASEAYLSDVSRPVKHTPAMEPYRRAEKQLQRMIYERFGVPGVAFTSLSLKLADEVLLATEARDLLGPAPVKWQGLPAPLTTRITPWPMNKARDRFLMLFASLAEATGEAIGKA